MDSEDLIDWLKQGEEWDAAEILSQCELRYDWMDIGIPLGGGPEIDIVELNVHAPRSVLDRIGGDLQPEVEAIERAVEHIAQAQHCYVQTVRWVARLGAANKSPSDEEVEQALAKLDEEHVRSAWMKAMSRRSSDADGAITAAKTLVESVCKHILRQEGIAYPANPDLPALYHLVAHHLDLAASLHVDKVLRRTLGNCQSVIQGIASLRNQLGDAHAREPGTEAPALEYAELAVNLAGAMGTFLARICERKGKGGTAHDATPNGDSAETPSAASPMGRGEQRDSPEP